jgi:hypothetical protein
MAVREIGIDICRVKICAAADGAKDGAQRFGTGEFGGIEFESPHGKISFLPSLVSETPDLDRHRLREFTRQVVHVDPSAAINVRRVFVREEERLHDGFLIARASKRTQIQS